MKRITALLLALVAPLAFATVKSPGNAPGGGGGGSGTVTSIGLTMPSVFTVAGSPVTTAGTFGVTYATGQTANQFLATPDGTTGAIGLRAIVAGDLPNLTGDVTSLAGVTTIAVGAVTDAKASLAVKPAVGLVATANLTLSGAQTIDGVAGTVAQTVVLATAQTTQSQNGPWTMQTGAWTRPSWYPSGGTTQAFQFITTAARIGTLYQGTTWRQTAVAPITIDTTATTWSETPLALNSTSVTGTLPAANLPAGVPTGSANPSATLGLTAVNGSAATYMTSDSAPALSQAIVPTWTGIHTWSLTEPRLRLNQSGAGTDLKNWDIDVASGVFTMRTRTDADAAGKNWLAVTRGTTTAISDVSLGNATDNNTFQVLGTGIESLNGEVDVLRAAGGGVLSMKVASTAPVVEMQRTSSSADAKRWGFDAGTSNALSFYAENDAGTVFRNFVNVQRTGAALTSENFGNATDNPTYGFLGTGTASFGGSVASSATLSTANAAPSVVWNATGQGTDQKRWAMDEQSANVWKFRTITDASASGSDIFSIARGTGTAVSSITFGNATDNPTYTFSGTGTLTMPGGGSWAGNGTVTTGGGIGMGNWTVTASAVPVNGMYRPATNTLGFAANTTAIGSWSTTIFDVLTDLAVDTVGKGLQVKEGTNGKQGICTLAAGTCTVTTTSVTANSRIFLTEQTLGTITVPSALAVSARTAGTSFTILASALTDTSVVAYEIFEPAP